MKNFTLLLMSLLSWCSYAQLAQEGFEAETFPPPGWAVFQNSSGSLIWAHNPSNRPAHTGARAAFMERQNALPANGNPVDYLATPSVEIPADPQLRFWSRLTVGNDQGTIYRIMVKLADGTQGAQNAIAGYEEIQTWTEQQLNPVQEEYVQKVVNIPDEYIGQNIYIAFVMTSALNNGDRWLIDDVDVVTECFAPTGVSASGISQTTANFTWENPSGATSWEIEVKLNDQAFNGTNTVIYTGTLPYALSSLTEDSDYKIRIRAICSEQNISPWSATTYFSTVAPGASCEAAAPITSLPFTVTGNTSNFGSTYDGSPGASGCGSTNNYLSGNDVVYAYTPTQNQIISVTLSNITDTYAGMFVYTSCDDIGVNCFGGAVNQSSTDDLEIEQLTLTAGTTYYIVISTWAWPQTTGYTLNLQVENCAKPTNITATGATTSGITLAWQENGTATSWQYALQPVGSGLPTGNGTTANATTVTLNTLPASTAYDVYVRANCGNGTFSSWAGPLRFNTLCEALDLPFSEGFNTDSETEFCWTVLDANEDGDAWDLNYQFDTFEGDQVAVMYTDGNNGENDDWLISPTINLTGNQRLRYRYKSQSSFEPDAFEVKLSTTGIDPVSFTTTLVPLATNNNTEYVEVIVNIVNNSNIPFSGPVNIAWHVPAGGPDGWRLFLDDVIIEDIPSCPDPLSLSASNQTQNSATLTWIPGFNETSWSIVVQPQGTGAPTGTGTAVPGTLPTYPATGLQPSTAYEFYVRANCANGDSSNWTGPYLFMTTQIPAVLDYTQDFETAQTGWSLSNGTQENKWVIGSAVSNGGTKSLYISNDNGTSNVYNNGGFSIVHAYRDIQMPEVADQINVSFDWKSQGENNWDYLTVWMVPVSFVPTPGIEITADNSGGIQIGGNYQMNNTFTTVNNVVNVAEYSGDVMRFIFEWQNDFSGGQQPPVAVDNVNISVITCPSPANLEVDDITLNEATISWDSPVSVSPSFDYYVSTAPTAPTGTTVPTGTTEEISADLVNLDESTIYYVWVRSNCGTENGNSFWIGPVQFHTQCGPFNTPFYEGFNSDSSSEFCWTVTDENNDDNTWNLNTDFNQYEGNQTASLNTYYGFGDNDDWLISPTIILAPNQRLKFRYKVNSSFEPNHFEVLLSTTGTNPESFTNVIVPLATYSNGEYIESVTNIDAFTGPVNIAWHVPANGPAGGWELYIDNVIIEDIPPCPEPTDVAVSCLSSGGANFTWTPGSTETSWEVAVVTSNQQIPTSGTVVTEPEYFTEGLSPETGYNFYVRAICPDNAGVGSWVVVNFQTPTTSVLDAQGFCASEGSAILFNNTFGGANEPYGPVACLYSTPNPVWYYLQVDSPGQLDFRIIQNTSFDSEGNPNGQGLDVDFVAFGPFNALTEACTDIVLEQCPTCPNNTANPDFYPVAGTNIIDCSYDGAFIENFTIPNVQTGQIYAVLITNFNGSQGQIKLEQLDTSTATTNCNVAYNVALGNDKVLCGETETTITATVTSPANSQQPSFQWFEDDAPFTPTIVSTTATTQTIEVTGDIGVHEYSVVVTVENASNTEPITDTVVVTFGPEVNAVEPADFTACDDNADGLALFNLTELNAEILGTQNPADFTVQFFTTEANATGNVNAITTPAAFTNTTPEAQIIYARVQSIVSPVCFDVVPVQLVVKPAPVVTLNQTLSICEGTTGTITANIIANATYVWYNDNGIITGQSTNTLTVTQGGTYTLEVTVDDCTVTKQSEVTIIPAPAFNLGGPYVVCKAESAFIEVNPENFDGQIANYQWSFEGNSLTEVSGRLQATQFGTYQVIVTVNGCSSAPQNITVSQNTAGFEVAFESECEGIDYIVNAMPVDNSFNPDTAQYLWTSNIPGFVPATTRAVTLRTKGTYTLTVTTTDGCVVSTDFVTNSTYCMIQKGISPNNDNRNDSFDLTALEVRHLAIFNRYGAEVYSLNNYTNQWVGQGSNGDELPTGTYYYMIERNNGEQHTGWIYVNREEN